MKHIFQRAYEKLLITWVGLAELQWMSGGARTEGYGKQRTPATPTTIINVAV